MLKNKENKIISLICLISIVLSLSCLVFKKPNSWFDEFSHYMRAIQIANGDIKTSVDGDDMSQVGGYISVDESYFVDEMIIAQYESEEYIGFGWWNDFSDAEYSDELQFRSATNTIPYFPIAYLPYVIAVWVA